MENHTPSLRSNPPKAQYTYDNRPGNPPLTPSVPKRVSASALLSQFKARPSPSSISRMKHTTTPKQPESASTLNGSDQTKSVSVAIADTELAADVPSQSSPSVKSEDSALSNIDVAAPAQSIDAGASPARPIRSTRATVSYVPLKPATTPRSSKKKVQMEKILESDAMGNPPDVNHSSKSEKPFAIKPDTARNRVRNEMATKTKAKRDAFLLHYKEHFLPLLPETNYITKLAGTEGELPKYTPHQQLLSQPTHVTATMKPYQLQGLSFLATMYKNCMSAILGDEMGLGKTLQTLSLIQYLEETHPCPPGIARPYLVVCPLSVLESWYNECRKWTPKLRPMRFHGNASEREHLKQRALGKVDRFGNETAKTKKKRAGKRNVAPGRPNDDAGHAEFDILITTYEVFVSEQSWIKQAFVWRYIILDEGHKIKNEKTSVSHALQGLKAEHRLLLTGTPMQNNLREMWALLHWLFPDVFTDKTSDLFAEAFDIGKGNVSTEFMDHARRLLELVMLRRLKNSPGVNLGLPPKSEILLYVPLTPIQRFWYTRLLTKAGGTLMEDLFTNLKDKEQKALKDENLDDDEKDSLLGQAAGATTNGIDNWAESRQYIKQAIDNDNTAEEKHTTSAYKKLLNLVMQLRKCCIHPYQIKDAAPDPYVLGDHIMHASGKFMALSKIVDQLVIKEKKKILIFSGFTDTLNYCEDILFHKGANTHHAPFRFLRLDGDSARAKRNLDIRLFNEPSSDFRIMLISTKAGGLGLNLTAATEIVFLDEEWNPQITLQAEARAHRIGQTKPVTIYKICTQGTVEEQMMGRIRKKLYLSTKITESMRDIYSTPNASRKRKRTDNNPTPPDENEPQLGMGQLMSLVRRGAATLAHPEIDVNEMLSWDFDTLIEKCRDRPIDHVVANEADENGRSEAEEKEWLAKMERVECAVLDGVKYQRQVDLGVATPTELSRSDRRVGKNTTVMVDGFAINKESLQCADWEAVPTMAGKDPRLATPKREKAPPIQHQDHCQTCHDGGEVVLCAGCPRIYHHECLSDRYKEKSERKMGFHCSQHQCFDCEKNTSDAGGLIYRCRWCEKGFCEDCLDWETAKLIGGTLPEFDMLEYTSRNAWYVECHHCTEASANDAAFKKYFDDQRALIEKEHERYTETLLVNEQAAAQETIEEEQRLREAAKVKREAEAAAASAALFNPATDEFLTDATTLSSSGVLTPLNGKPLPRAKTRSATKKQAQFKSIEPQVLDHSDAESIPTGEVHPATNGGFLRRVKAPRNLDVSEDEASMYTARESPFQQASGGENYGVNSTHEDDQADVPDSDFESAPKRRRKATPRKKNRRT